MNIPAQIRAWFKKKKSMLDGVPEFVPPERTHISQRRRMTLVPLVSPEELRVPNLMQDAPTGPSRRSIRDVAKECEAVPEPIGLVDGLYTRPSSKEEIDALWTKSGPTDSTRRVK